MIKEASINKILLHSLCGKSGNYIIEQLAIDITHYPNLKVLENTIVNESIFFLCEKELDMIMRSLLTSSFESKFLNDFRKKIDKGKSEITLSTFKNFNKENVMKGENGNSIRVLEVKNLENIKINKNKGDKANEKILKQIFHKCIRKTVEDLSIVIGINHQILKNTFRKNSVSTENTFTFHDLRKIKNEVIECYKLKIQREIKGKSNSLSRKLKNIKIYNKSNETTYDKISRFGPGKLILVGIKN